MITPFLSSLSNLAFAAVRETFKAVEKIFNEALARFGDAPENLFQVIIGDYKIGEVLTNSRDIAILSATGSTRMGRMVGPIVASRFGVAF